MIHSARQHVELLQVTCPYTFVLTVSQANLPWSCAAGFPSGHNERIRHQPRENTATSLRLRAAY